MDSDDLKDSLLNLLSILKNTKNIDVPNDAEKDSIEDIVEQIRSILWMNSNVLSNDVSEELEEALSGLIKYYPQDISEKESFIMRVWIKKFINKKKNIQKFITIYIYFKILIYIIINLFFFFY